MKDGSVNVLAEPDECSESTLLRGTEYTSTTVEHPYVNNVGLSLCGFGSRFTSAESRPLIHFHQFMKERTTTTTSCLPANYYIIHHSSRLLIGYLEIIAPWSSFLKTKHSISTMQNRRDTRSSTKQDEHCRLYSYLIWYQA